MVALNQKRFNSTDDKTGELRNGAKNVNTGKTTSFWLSVWKTWCEGKSIALELKGHEPAELNSTNSTPTWKKKYDLPAPPPREVFYVSIINK